MRRPRFRLRTLMIVTSIAGLATWGYVLLERRSEEFAAHATRHWNNLIYLDDRIRGIDGHWNNFVMCRTANEETERERYLRRLDYEGRMFLKYSHAARLPWLAVGSDPPPPAVTAPPPSGWTKYRRHLLRR
jgi:hypothetical protein